MRAEAEVALVTKISAVVGLDVTEKVGLEARDIDAVCAGPHHTSRGTGGLRHLSLDHFSVI